MDAHLQTLLEQSIQPDAMLQRSQLGQITHIFSHIRMILQVEHLKVKVYICNLLSSTLQLRMHPACNLMVIVCQAWFMFRV